MKYLGRLIKPDSSQMPLSQNNQIFHHGHPGYLYKYMKQITITGNEGAEDIDEEVINSKTVWYFLARYLK